jgi:hypothetical protein
MRMVSAWAAEKSHTFHECWMNEGKKAKKSANSACHSSGIHFGWLRLKADSAILTGV